MEQADFTIADVLAWARTKPQDEGYSFCEPSRCAVAQFGLASGRKYLVGVADPLSVAPQLWPAMMALCLSRTFGELVSALEPVVEPRLVKRAWARLTGKTIGAVSWSMAPLPVSDTWAKADAYMADIERVDA